MLAEETATALHTIPRCQVVPSLAYKIGDCTLEKDGTLRIPDSVDGETVDAVLAYLKEKDFTGKQERAEDRLTVSVPREDFTGKQERAEDRLTVSVPREDFTGKQERTEDRLTVSVPGEGFTDTALANLRKIVENKGALLARAFQQESVRLVVAEDTISFPWFPLSANPDENAAYTEFVSRLCEMARNSKRVSDKPTETDNDKYTFRCFLLRLGFIGNKYKATRKILPRSLTGNTAFRHGA